LYQAKEDMVLSVYEKLRLDIVAGRLEPGTQLTETSLATRYGISRTPIREALQRLEHEGLVVRESRGMFVRQSSPQEILDIYEARITLEATAARAAAQRRTELDLIRLKSAYRAMQELPLGDPSQQAETNRIFHEAVWDASHNPTLVDLLRRLNTHLLRYPATTLSQGDRWVVVLNEYAQLIAAIESRDSVAAFAIAEEHMSQAREIRLKMFGGAERSAKNTS
jgi:DNA-binding GntR family transcriptional regulator